MYAHEALAVFSLVRRGTCQQLTNGRRSPVLASLHVDPVYPSIDDPSFLPFLYRRGKTTLLFYIEVDRLFEYIYIYIRIYSLTFSNLTNSVVRKGTEFFPFEKTSAFLPRFDRPSHAPLSSPGFANVCLFSRDTRPLFLYLPPRLTTRLPVAPPSPPLASNSLLPPSYRFAMLAARGLFGIARDEKIK